MANCTKKKRNSSKAPKQRPPKKDFGNIVLALIALMAIAGSLYLAIVDPESRPIFEDLAKICVSGFIGWLMPREYSGS